MEGLRGGGKGAERYSKGGGGGGGRGRIGQEREGRRNEGEES